MRRIGASPGARTSCLPVSYAPSRSSTRLRSKLTPMSKVAWQASQYCFSLNSSVNCPGLLRSKDKADAMRQCYSVGELGTERQSHRGHLLRLRGKDDAIRLVQEVIPSRFAFWPCCGLRSHGRGVSGQGALDAERDQQEGREGNQQRSARHPHLAARSICSHRADTSGVPTLKEKNRTQNRDQSRHLRNCTR